MKTRRMGGTRCRDSSTFLVVCRGGRDGDVEPLSQGVGVPDGELLSRLDIAQSSVENLGGEKGHFFRSLERGRRGEREVPGRPGAASGVPVLLADPK